MIICKENSPITKDLFPYLELYRIFVVEKFGSKYVENRAGGIGFTDTFFKLNEGKPGDGICAITDWKGKLRLYCIRFGNILLVLGGGGPKTTRTYQEDPKLLSENLLLRNVSDVMAEAIREKDLKIEEDGSLSGDLVIEF